MTDLHEDPEFQKFRKSVIEDLIPKLESSRMMLSLVPEGETDIKFAVEPGLGIMMDKPLIAVIKPGVKVPAKLALVVDRWVEGDVTTEAGREQLSKAINEAFVELGDEE